MITVSKTWTAGKGIQGQWHRKKLDVYDESGTISGSILPMSYHGTNGWRRRGYTVLLRTTDGISSESYTIDCTEDWSHVQGGRVWFCCGTHETLRSALKAAKAHAVTAR